MYKSFSDQNGYCCGQCSTDNGGLCTGTSIDILFHTVTLNRDSIDLISAYERSPLASGLGNGQGILRNVLVRFICLEDSYNAFT